MRVQSRLDWRGAQKPERLDGSILLGGDLHQASFRDCLIENVEFFGCDLTASTFSGSTLRNCHFIGCFTRHGVGFADFREARLSNVTMSDSFLTTKGIPGESLRRSEPADVKALAKTLLCEVKDERAMAAASIGADPSPSQLKCAFLVFLLSDYEWVVRLAAAKALCNIRERQSVLPRHDAALVERILSLLGDDVPFVRATAAELITSLDPDDEQLRRVTNIDLRAPTRGLHALETLVHRDPAYGILADLFQVEQVARSGFFEARLAAVEILRCIGGDTLRSAMHFLVRDSAPEVRLAALLSVSWTSLPDISAWVRAFTEDTDPEVRLEAFKVADEFNLLDEALVARGLGDMSDEIRRFAERNRRGDK